MKNNRTLQRLKVTEVSTQENTADIQNVKSDIVVIDGKVTKNEVDILVNKGNTAINTEKNASQDIVLADHETRISRIERFTAEDIEVTDLEMLRIEGIPNPPDTNPDLSEALNDNVAINIKIATVGKHTSTIADVIGLPFKFDLTVEDERHYLFDKCYVVFNDELQDVTQFNFDSNATYPIKYLKTAGREYNLESGGTIILPAKIMVITTAFTFAALERLNNKTQNQEAIFEETSFSGVLKVDGKDVKASIIQNENDISDNSDDIEEFQKSTAVLNDKTEFNEQEVFNINERLANVEASGDTGGIAKSENPNSYVLPTIPVLTIDLIATSHTDIDKIEIDENLNKVDIKSPGVMGISGSFRIDNLMNINGSVTFALYSYPNSLISIISRAIPANVTNYEVTFYQTIQGVTAGDAFNLKYSANTNTFITVTNHNIIFSLYSVASLTSRNNKLSSPSQEVTGVGITNQEGANIEFNEKITTNGEDNTFISGETPSDFEVSITSVSEAIVQRKAGGGIIINNSVVASDEAVSKSQIEDIVDASIPQAPIVLEDGGNTALFEIGNTTVIRNIYPVGTFAVGDTLEVHFTTSSFGSSASRQISKFTINIGSSPSSGGGLFGYSGATNPYIYHQWTYLQSNTTNELKFQQARRTNIASGTTSDSTLFVYKVILHKKAVTVMKIKSDKK